MKLARKNVRGAQLVEVCALIAGLALAGGITFRAFGGSLKQGAGCQGDGIHAVAAGGGGGGGACSGGKAEPAKVVAAATPIPGTGAPAGAPICDSSGRCTGTRCFVAGTLVDVPGGQRPIETLEPKDLVVADDDATGDRGTHAVYRTYRTDDREVARLVLEVPESREQETFTVTPEHPFFVVGAGWVAVRDLVPGHSYVTRRDGHPARVLAVQSLAARETVYNLTVEDAHTYFVGASHAWVHNQYLPPNAAERDRILRGPPVSAPPIWEVELQREVPSKYASSKYGKYSPGSKFVDEHGTPHYNNAVLVSEKAEVARTRAKAAADKAFNDTHAGPPVLKARPKVGDIRPGNGGNFVLVELQHPSERKAGWGVTVGKAVLGAAADASLATPAAPAGYALKAVLKADKYGPYIHYWLNDGTVWKFVPDRRAPVIQAR